MVKQNDTEEMYRRSKEKKETEKLKPVSRVAERTVGQSAHAVVGKSLKAEINIKSVLKAAKILEKSAKTIDKAFDDAIAKAGQLKDKKPTPVKTDTVVKESKPVKIELPTKETKAETATASVDKAEKKKKEPREAAVKTKVELELPKNTKLNVSARITEVIPPIENAEIPVTAKIEDVLPPDFVSTIPVTGQPVDAPDMSGDMPDFMDSKAALDDYLKQVNDADLSVQPNVEPLDHKKLQDQYAAAGLEIPAHLADIETDFDIPAVDVPIAPVVDKSKFKKTTKTLEDLRETFADPSKSVADGIVGSTADIGDRESALAELKTQLSVLKDEMTSMQQLGDVAGMTLKKKEIKKVSEEIALLGTAVKKSAAEQGTSAKTMEKEFGSAAEALLKMLDNKNFGLADKAAKKFQESLSNLADTKDDLLDLEREAESLGNMLRKAVADKNVKLIKEYGDGLSEVHDRMAELNKEVETLTDNMTLSAAEQSLSAKEMEKDFIAAAEAQLKFANDKNFSIAEHAANKAQEAISKIAETKDELADVSKEAARLAEKLGKAVEEKDVQAIKEYGDGLRTARTRIEELNKQVVTLTENMQLTATESASTAHEMAKDFIFASQAQLKLLDTKKFGKAEASAIKFQEAVSKIADLKDNILDLRKEADVLGDKLRKAIADKNVKLIKEYGDELSKVHRRMEDVNKDLRHMNPLLKGFDGLKDKISGSFVAFASAGASLALFNSALQQSVKYSNYLTESALDMGQTFDWNNQTFEVAGVQLTGSTAAYAKATAEIAKMNAEGQTWGLTQEESMKLAQDLKKKGIIPQGEAVEEAAHQYLALAKTMRVDVNTAMEMGHMNMRKFGVSAEESMNIMANTAMTWNKGSDAIHKSSIRLEDYRGIMDRVTDSNVHASQNTRVLNQLMIGQLDKMKKLGATDKDAMEATEALSKAIGNAPDWIKWEVGIDMYKDLGKEVSNISDKKFKELQTKYSEHASLMEGRSDKEKKTFLALEEKYGKEVSAAQLATLAKMVNNEEMPLELRQKNMEAFLGATEAGMEATGNRIAKFSLEAGTESMQKDLGLTATQAGNLWQEMSEAKKEGGDAGKVFSKMMKGYKAEADKAKESQDKLLDGKTDLEAATMQGEAAQGPATVKDINAMVGKIETLLNNPLTKTALGIASSIGAIGAMGVSAATGMAQLFYLKKIAAGGGMGGGGSSDLLDFFKKDKGSAAGSVGKEAAKAGAKSGAKGLLKTGAKGLLKKIPLIGSLIGAGFAAKEIYDAKEEGQKGKEFNKTVGGSTGSAVGGMGGALGGAAVGAAVGSVVPILGTAIGGIVGGLIGGFGGDMLGKFIGESVAEKVSSDDISGSAENAIKKNIKPIDVPVVGSATAVPQTKTQSSLINTPGQKAAVKTATKAAVETAKKILPEAKGAASGVGATGAKAGATATSGGGGLEGSVATLLPNGDVSFTVKGFDQILSQFQGQVVRQTK